MAGLDPATHGHYVPNIETIRYTPADLLRATEYVVKDGEYMTNFNVADYLSALRSNNISEDTDEKKQKHYERVRPYYEAGHTPEDVAARVPELAGGIVAQFRQHQWFSQAIRRAQRQDRLVSWPKESEHNGLFYDGLQRAIDMSQDDAVKTANGKIVSWLKNNICCRTSRGAKNLAIVGPTGQCKTELVLALSRFVGVLNWNYGAGPQDTQYQQVPEQLELIVLDEFRGQMPLNALNQIADNTFQLRRFHQESVELDKWIPILVFSNIDVVDWYTSAAVNAANYGAYTVLLETVKRRFRQVTFPPTSVRALGHICSWLHAWAEAHAPSSNTRKPYGVGYPLPPEFDDLNSQIPRPDELGRKRPRALDTPTPEGV